MTAQSVRQFFRELFGSRLIEILELQLLQTRSDFEARLHERDEMITNLRTQIATLEMKVDQYDNLLHPNLFAPKDKRPLEFINEPDPGSWEGIQRAWYKKQEEVDNGVPEPVRKEI